MVFVRAWFESWTHAVSHSIQTLPRQPAIVRHATHVKIDASIDFVGVVKGIQKLDKLDHLSDVVGSLGLHMWMQDVERRCPRKTAW